MTSTVRKRERGGKGKIEERKGGNRKRQGEDTQTGTVLEVRGTGRDVLLLETSEERVSLSCTLCTDSPPHPNQTQPTSETTITFSISAKLSELLIQLTSCLPQRHSKHSFQGHLDNPEHHPCFKDLNHTEIYPLNKEIFKGSWTLFNVICLPQ